MDSGCCIRKKGGDGVVEKVDCVIVVWLRVVGSDSKVLLQTMNLGENGCDRVGDWKGDTVMRDIYQGTENSDEDGGDGTPRPIHDE